MVIQSAIVVGKIGLLSKSRTHFYVIYFGECQFSAGNMIAVITGTMIDIVNE